MEYFLAGAFLFALFALDGWAQGILVVGAAVLLYLYKTGFPAWMTYSFEGVAVVYWLAAPFLLWWLIAHVFVSVFAPKKD